MNKVFKKNVCHLTTVHPISDIRIFEKECITLASNGYDVTLIACGDSEFEEVKKNVKLIQLKIPVKNRLQRFLKRSKAVYEKALEVDADIYHFHDPDFLPYGFLLKQKGKKVIFDSHEDVPSDIRNKSYLNPLVRYLLFLIYKAFEPYIISKFDAVISVTPHIVNKLQNLNKNTFQITNYPIISHQEQNDDVIISKYSKPTIFFAGGVSPLWMHENIIKALENINFDIQYIIAGPSSDHYLEKLKTLKCWNKVDYIGKISHNEVASYYSKSHIGIAILNQTDSSGGIYGTLGNTKIFEIMYSKLPIICSDFVLWKQIVEGNNCGICVNQNNIESISNAILQLLNNREESNVMGLNGRNTVLNQYNWSTQEKILLDIYKKII